MAGGFDRNTRNKIVPLATQTKPTGGGTTILELPKMGILARIYLRISATVSGTLSAPNLVGASSIIRRIRVSTNSGIDIYNVSGAGDAYLMSQMQELERGFALPNNGGSNAVTATTFRLDRVIPIWINLHDPLGAILLQNEQLQVLLTIEWEQDAVVATGATVAATAVPYVEFFTVPPLKEDWPPFNVVHQVIEDQIPIATIGDYIYNLPRGNTYLQVGLGYGLAAASTADHWSKAILRINQSDILYQFDPNLRDVKQGYLTGLSTTQDVGTLIFDFLGSDGLGNYGSARDFINSALLTDLQIVLTTTAADTLYVVRRMLMPLIGG